MSVQIANAYNTVGHEKVMFGIDSPFHAPTVEIQKIMACGVMMKDWRTFSIITQLNLWD